MPSSRPIQRRGALTRARILDAAAVRFSTRSYEQVGLRDIAADVGVDVALVHRAFGSKEQLFAETLKRTLQPELLNPVDRPLSEHLALKLLKEPAQKKRAPVDPVLMIVRSISHPQAGAIIKRQMQEDFLGPLADKLIEPADQRAALAAGCLLGIAILRDVLQINALVDVRNESALLLISRVLESCFEDGSPTGRSDTVRRKGSHRIPRTPQPDILDNEAMPPKRGQRVRSEKAGSNAKAKAGIRYKR